ncbi:MAG: PqqD family protein, partial [Planctomycetota bacterium]
PKPPAEIPRASEHVRVLPLAFDRANIDERVSAMDSSTLRARYQSDLLEAEDIERFDAETDPEPRAPAVLVYDARTAEVRCFSPAAAALLERCNGERTVEQVIEIIPHEAHDDARACLAELSGAGLIDAHPNLS